MSNFTSFETAPNGRYRPQSEASESSLRTRLQEEPAGSAPLAFDLSTVWAHLCSRRVRHVGTFFSARDCGALLEFAAGEPFGPPLPERDLSILERALHGEDQTAVAIELGRSASAISMSLRRTLHAMGFDCTGCRLPLFLAMVAHAAHARRSSVRVATGLVERGGRMHRWVILPRPDGDLWTALSRSEAAVARLLVEGKTHAEIAALRGTSLRTVANQLAASFQKLRVSGRSQLLNRSVVQVTGAFA